jgi:alkanesulfonate monooxygenase SsuD/methylene tetrahydromethanopterin reductase-like flavin-dependent oxidoreductase (luciferase family)
MYTTYSRTARLWWRKIDRKPLRERLVVGPPETCAEKLVAYKAAGVQECLCGR